MGLIDKSRKDFYFEEDQQGKILVQREDQFDAMRVNPHRV